MPELPGQRRVRSGEGGLAHEHVGPLGKRERGITQPGIHDEREPLARPELAHLLYRHEPFPGEQAAVTLQAADVWSGNSRCRELVREHPPAVRLGQRVAEGRHAVRELPGFQAERPLPADRAVGMDRPFQQGDRLAVEGRVPQPREYFGALRRVANLDRVSHLVERHPLEHARQAEAVVSVEMGDADAADLARRHAGELHLALRALARVEQQALGIPPEQIAIVVPAASGHLAGSAENHEFPVGHGTDLTPGRPRDEPQRRAAWQAHGRWQDWSAPSARRNR